MTERAARCELCKSTQGLRVWYGDDGYGWPFGHTVRCGACPKPENPFIDESSAYNPLVHDKPLGLSDWDVPFEWILNTGKEALCFACSTRFDPEQAHGGEYLPEALWSGRNNTRLLFCRNCFIKRRRGHTDIEQELGREVGGVLRDRIAAYFAVAPEGLVKNVLATK